MNTRRITRYGFAWFNGKIQTATQVGHFNGPTPPPSAEELRILKRLRK